MYLCTMRVIGKNKCEEGVKSKVRCVREVKAIWHLAVKQIHSLLFGYRMELRVIESSINSATIILLIHKKENVKSNFSKVIFLPSDLSTGRPGRDTRGQPHIWCGDQHTGSLSTQPGPRPRHLDSPWLRHKPGNNEDKISPKILDI